MPARGRTSEGLEGATRRRVVYCLIPGELADKLHDPLRRHFRDDPSVEVVVERRGRERRSGAERREAEAAAPAQGAPGGEAEDAPFDGAERRQVRASAGRRGDERRAAAVPVEAPRLPRRAQRYAERLTFFERFEPSTQKLEDRDTARVVARFQAGDTEAFATLYTRYYGRVYGYLKVVLRDHHEAEDAAQQAFTQAFENLGGYERGAQPFRAWLFTIARNGAISCLRKSGREQLTAPDELDRRREAPDEGEQDLTALGWITDPDLVIFAERLPLPQRQVLVLRYAMGMEIADIARVLERTEVDVRGLHYRAMEFLRARLAAIGREAPSTRGAKMQRRMQQAPVLRYRRFALKAP